MSDCPAVLCLDLQGWWWCSVSAHWVSLWGTDTCLSVCLSVDGPPLFLYCRACPPPQHLLNRLFGCFYMAVFYHFCCFNLMWFLFHCTPCLYSSLPSVCEGQRWPVKATVCLLRRGGAFISVLCFLPAPLVHTHTHIHTQQYHTASSYVFMLVFCKQ